MSWIIIRAPENTQDKSGRRYLYHTQGVDGVSFFTHDRNDAKQWPSTKEGREEAKRFIHDNKLKRCSVIPA